MNKYSSGSTNGVKRTNSVTSLTKAEKIPRLNKTQSNNNILNAGTTADCPSCLEPVQLTRFNEHLDECLAKPRRKKCIICKRDVLVAEYELHVPKCLEENFDGPREKSDDSGSKKCTVCEKMLPEAEFDTHVEECLLKFYDDMEDEYSDKDGRVDCLTCGKNIDKSELNSHLDDCMGLSQVFDGKKSPTTGEDKGSCDNDKFNCPFCMVLVSEKEMSSHIDLCLNTASSSPQGQFNKNVLMESLLEEDF